MVQPEHPKADPPKRKRRWFQFSLRTLLVVMLLAGAASIGSLLNMPAVKRLSSR